MLTTEIFHTCAGVVYLLAFLSLFFQWQGLYGYNGLLPVDSFTESIKTTYFAGTYSFDNFMKFPSIIAFADDLGLLPDVACTILIMLGLFCSSFICCGCHNIFLYFICWGSYLSLFLVGRTFLSFQWDILLIEVGFILLWSSSLLTIRVQPSLQLNWCYRFLAWKLMFLSGVVKLQANCPTWRNLTALEYHFATQCLPAPAAWWAHQLPPIILRASVAATILIEIPFTLLLLFPCRISRRIGVFLQIFLQITIFLTGNYNFFNILTIILMLPAWAEDQLLDTSTEQHHTSTEYAKSIMNVTDVEGPFLSFVYFWRWFDDTRIGRYLQYLIVIIGLCISSSYFISYKVLEPGKSVTSFGDNIQLYVSVPYKELETWLLPISACAICK